MVKAWIMGSSVCLGRVLERPVARLVAKGAFVDCGEFGELFVPLSQLPEGLKSGDALKVFLYADRGRIQATARHPYLEVGMVGKLRVKYLNHGTGYLDLGIPKDLVVPVSEQLRPFREGTSEVVYLTSDAQGRLFGTQRFDRYLQERAPAGTFAPGEEVSCVPLMSTPLGWRTAVNDRFLGLIYRSREYGRIISGRRCRGYITTPREDGKIDVTLQEPGLSGTVHTAGELLQILERAGGFLPFNDYSDPRDIDAYLHMSKSRFKKAAGHLYKQRLIVIAEDGIRLSAMPAAQATVPSGERQEAASVESPGAPSEGRLEPVSGDAQQGGTRGPQRGSA